jgi:predicted RNase H-like HicB family nuclease
MRYPATITRDGEFFFVAFRDFNGNKPVTHAFSYEKALEMAKEWLDGQTKKALQRNISLPMASSIQEGEIAVEMTIPCW